MARARTAKHPRLAPQPVEPEEESQEVPEQEEAQDEPEGEPAKGTVSKADAARAAIQAGIEAPGEAVGYIKKRFGIEMGRQHFSAMKSQVRKKEREEEEAPKP